MSDELRDQVNKAFSDIEHQTPDAPSWAAITVGYAPLTAATPRPRWFVPAVVAAAAAAVVLVVVVGVVLGGQLGAEPETLATETTATSTTEAATVTVEDLYGVWVLDSYTFKGETVSSDDVISAGYPVPYLDITADAVNGNTGCNDIGSLSSPNEPFKIEFDGTNLRLGQMASTAVGCREGTAEPAMTAAVFAGSIRVTVGPGSMTWTTDEVELRFVRRDRQPEPTVVWQQQFDVLDCTPSYVIGVDRYGNLSGEDLPAIVPGVVTVDGSGVLGSEDPWAYGYDAEGAVIAVGAQGDIQPVPFHVFACSISFNLNPAIDPGLAVSTYVNQTGLGQASQQVWGNRLADLCASPGSAIDGAAILVEDGPTSLLPGGALPPVETVTSALEAVSEMICVFPTTPTPLSSTTTIPPVTTTSVSGDRTCSTQEGIPGPPYDDLDPGGLTAAAEAMRMRLVELAHACDFETLVALNAESGLVQPTDGIFWGAAGSVESLRQYDTDYKALNQLAWALSFLPYSTEEWEPNPGEVEVYYQWPPVADLPDGGSLEDLWDPALLAAVAALNDLSVADLIAHTNEFGAYFGFRVGISESGRWMFALGGD
ncbi:MAG: hypothetical protein KDB69_03720 [Acidimicrobiia bacterium]|nr:hypothetical protein [Acidimicrobiia bacterium]